MKYYNNIENKVIIGLRTDKLALQYKRLPIINFEEGLDKKIKYFKQIIIKS